MTEPELAAICVFCSSSEDIDSSFVDLAAAVGAEIGRRGHTLVSGGGRVSMMGAVARATRHAGGRTIGVIPAALRSLEVADELADELVVTATMRERKAEMEGRADGFLALPGGIGTLEELLEIWVARSLGFHSKPVVVLDPQGVFAPLRHQVALLHESGFLKSAALECCVFVSSAVEAFDFLDAAWVDPTRRVTAPEVSELLEAEADVSAS